MNVHFEEVCGIAFAALIAGNGVGFTDDNSLDGYVGIPPGYGLRSQV
jgi:hypothetical protein